MCTIPKNGCTQWKRLILKAMGHNSSVYLDEKASHLTVHGGQYKYLPRVLKRRMLDSLEDESTFRVVFSRNPFVRLLSSYLNKLVKANDRHRLRQKLGLDVWSDNLTFADSVSALQRWADAVPGGLALSSGIDHHFALQSSFCGLANDNQSQLHYDWVLKTEEINSWYPCLVDALNLSAVVGQGPSASSARRAGRATGRPGRGGSLGTDGTRPTTGRRASGGCGCTTTASSSDGSPSSTPPTLRFLDTRRGSASLATGHPRSRAGTGWTEGAAPPAE
uniref:Carbohydrate sulfotransferase n=1 Tax=Tetraselmis sp. GSL018 TaxID=582737 RepID=A0A061S402_9CHLO|eukprot:CAMPEP_0177605826 /NCGR_PEP_ID=MMETSP0419_2-20121207/16925_1 /TAXON_ID=582737 /ORGANISM="Tetraselmis sp., Strain GSL018" /LENGTH=276 /DNA_ID=CAMNT_0019100035 /DNA_START=854 /DNA_END=1684 /DNA_ORIENTATION=-